MKAFVLARESDKKQDSNDAQIGRLEGYIKLKQFSPLVTYKIKESSTRADRKQFMKIIEAINKEKETVAFVVDTIDRMQRSFRESVILDDLRREGKVEIHFYRENLVLHKDSNSADLLRWDMGVMFARSYVLQLSDNVKRKIEQKLRNGEWPGKAPYGYKNITLENDKKDIVVDEFESKVVRKVYEWYATKAFSINTLRQKLKDDYKIEWSKGFLDAVLKNPFYHGTMLMKGKLYPHKYPPIITKVLFDDVQTVKASFNKKPFKYAGKPYAYRGLLRCGHCGLAITPEKHKGIVYYHCTQYRGRHGAKWLTEAQISEQLGNVFKRLKMPEWVLDQIIDNLKVIHEGKSKFRDERLKKLNQQKQTYLNRNDKLYLDKLDGRITDSEYDRYYQSFREKIAETETQLAILQEAEDNYYITAKYLLELSNRAYDLFLNSEIEEKRQLIKLVLSNLEVKGENVRYQGQNPFNLILKYADDQLWLPR